MGVNKKGIIQKKNYPPASSQPRSMASFILTVSTFNQGLAGGYDAIHESSEGVLTQETRVYMSRE